MNETDDSDPEVPDEKDLSPGVDSAATDEFWSVGSEPVEYVVEEVEVEEVKEV